MKMTWADALGRPDGGRAPEAVRHPGRGAGGEIFSYLDDAEPYLKELPPEEAAQVVSHMDSDDAVDALDDLEEEDKEKIVHQMDKVENVSRR